MFQFLTILLAVTAVVTKAVPLTDHDQPLSLQQRNVRQLQTEEKIVDLGNISAPAYIMDLFTNISARQNQVLSKDALVNVVRSFPAFNLQFTVELMMEILNPSVGLQGCCQEVTLNTCNVGAHNANSDTCISVTSWQQPAGPHYTHL